MKTQPLSLWAILAICLTSLQLNAQFCKRDMIEESCHYPIKNKEMIYRQVDSFMTLVSRMDSNVSKMILPSDFELWGEPFSEISPYAIGYDYTRTTIVGMIDVEPNLFLIKLKFDYCPDSVQSGFLGIYNLVLHYKASEQRYQFEDYRSYYLRNNLQMMQVGNIIYHKKNKDQINLKEAEIYNRFNIKMAETFKTTPKTITYFSAKNSIDLLNLYGWDIKYNMFYAPSGGFAGFGGSRPGYQYLIYSGNNSERYDHELVHLYYSHLLDSAWQPSVRMASEGIPTYFGGSAGLDYQAHKNTLKEFLIKNDTVVISKYSQMGMDIQINDKSSYVYAMGAFIAELCYKKDGLKGLRFYAGLNDENFIKGLANYFGVKEEKLDAFLRKELVLK